MAGYFSAALAQRVRRTSLHENSVRYRLRKIAQLTGRDPRNITDLLELIAASRIITTPDGGKAAPR